MPGATSLLAAVCAMGAVGAVGAIVTPAGAQHPRSAILDDSVRVGDVVPVAVRVRVEPGQRVEWPDTLPLESEDLENAARVRVTVDTLPDGRLDVTGFYAVTPWRPGATGLPEVPVRVVSGDEVVETRTAALPTMDVVSVLPADTAGIEPRPAKGVLGASWTLWPFLLALLLLLALIAAAIWWVRRRRRVVPEVAAAPVVSPRDRALAALEEAWAAGLVERGEMKAFYTRIAAAVRVYLAELNPGWSEDLTSSELLAHVRSDLGPADSARLGDVLRPADQVKFAQRRPDAVTAREEWERARRWVEEFRRPAAPEPMGEAA